MANYQFVHRQRYKHCSPGRRCGEDFPQGTGKPPPDLHRHTHHVFYNCDYVVLLFYVVRTELFEWYFSDKNCLSN